jgi:biotin carboxyl carrier protein
MTYKEIQELIRQVSKSDLAEVKVKDGDSGSNHPYSTLFREQRWSGDILSGSCYCSAKRIYHSGSYSTSTKSRCEKPAEPKSSNLKEIRSPMVGTFYRSSGRTNQPMSSQAIQFLPVQWCVSSKQ